MEYRRLGTDEPLPATTLCAISFGPQRTGVHGSQALPVQLNLPVLLGAGLTELWHVDGRVEAGHEGAIHFARGGRFLAGRIEIDEHAAGGLEAAAAQAYAAISRFTTHGRHRHLLRMYNYFSGINAGSGDTERYKLFCSGRAGRISGTEAFVLAGGNRGRPPGSRQHAAGLLAGRDRTGSAHRESAPGQCLQLSAPVRAGAAPLFARHAGQRRPADLGPRAAFSATPRITRMICRPQLDEILRNLASLRQASGGPVQLPSGRGTVLKIYLRDAAAAGLVGSYLRARLPAQAQFLVLGADICRRELVVEIDAAHFGITG